jgi:hypothetical protein
MKIISRHLLTKKIMQALFTIYGKENISQATVVNVALNLTAIFYPNPMDRRDALRDANKIFHSIRLLPGSFHIHFCT